MTLHPQRRGRRAALALLGAAALTVSTATGVLATPDTQDLSAADAAAAQLATGETSMSENITHLANLPIYYMSSGGQRLYTEVVTLSEGRTTLRANQSRVPTG